jgi:hypothetical protein
MEGAQLIPEDDSSNRRTERKPVGIEGRYRTGSGVPRDVWITDLSRTGCRFFDRFGTMQRGKPITIRIGSIGPLPAVVRWWNNHVNGVEFEQPLHESVYDHLVASMTNQVPDRFQTDS